ncbi:MAG: hypothetical protein A3K67_02730 [Euryarchaeota archaeon RBG_16_62_10]|nr:MAG: hypothetical protein A3K67_02730 [Euryarchaeota archaeon RBG_16_62_10]
MPGGFGYSVSAVMLYPDTRWVFMASSEAGAEPASTGVSRVLLSALADDGRVAVVEVRAVAWPGAG